MCLFTGFQYDFWSSHPSRLANALNSSETCRPVATDISKAFDRV